MEPGRCGCARPVSRAARRLRVCAAGQPSSPEALTVIVTPPGLTTRVLDDDSTSTIVTWTVVVCPADSEAALRLMVKSSGSGFWIWIPETGPPLAVSVNEPVTPSCRLTACVEGTRLPTPGPGAADVDGAGDGPAGGTDAEGPDEEGTDAETATGAVAATPRPSGWVPGRAGAPPPADGLGAGVPGGAGGVDPGAVDGPMATGPGECGAFGLWPCVAYRIPAAIATAAAAPAPTLAACASGPWAACGGSSGLGNPDWPNGPARWITPARWAEAPGLKSPTRWSS